MDREHMISQAMAAFCILLGLVCVFIGCAKGDHFAAFTALAGTVAGAGLQAYTSTYRQQNINKGPVTVNDPAMLEAGHNLREGDVAENK